ncbi:MAG TPA: radical SAM protein, partial [Thermoanaerobaculia bacterium]
MAETKRVGMISLGCPKNTVDAEIMLGQLRQESEVVITNDLDEADVVIVNTCGFIDAAKQESIDTILEIAERKGRGVERLIVSGCMVQKYRAELQQSIPEIDAFVGLDHLEKITQAVCGAADSAADLAPVKRKMSVRLYEDLPRVLTTGTAHAYLKVSEGCSNPCTFCAIPQMRGKFRSRTIESLLREAQQLEASGVKELALVAQDTTRYGEDLGVPNGLTRLVEGLLNETGFE